MKRFPPNYFAIPFGLAGLAHVWRTMAVDQGSPAAIADVLYLAAALAWVVLMAGIGLRVLARPRTLIEEGTDPILTPFWALPGIVGMLLAVGLEPHAFRVARVLFLVFFVAVQLLGGWLTGEWIAGRFDFKRLHPGYFLPTVAGGLVGALAAASFGYHALGWFSFGTGVIQWLVLGSLVLNRLMFMDPLPPGVVPTLAIELAPPAVAGSAYFALHGPAPDAIAYGLAGYAVMTLITQVRLIPLYRALPFAPSFWSFTFSSAATASLGLDWLRVEHPGGESLLAALDAAAISLLIGAIAVRSIVFFIHTNQRSSTCRSSTSSSSTTSSPRSRSTLSPPTSLT